MACGAQGWGSRERLSDAQRIVLESSYCHVAASSYSMWLDFLILFNTVLVVTSLHRPFTFAEIRRLIARFDRGKVLAATAFADELEADAGPLPPR